MNEHGPPTPADATEELADPANGLIIVSAPSYTGEIELGQRYVFSFCGREVTGTAVRRKTHHIVFRTPVALSVSYTVPVTDILRRA